jgi:hypothetical protein
MSDLDKLLKYVIKEEKKYYELSLDAMDMGDTIGNKICAAQACAFQRMRYTIEDMMEVK